MQLDEDRLSPARAWTLGTLASFALSSPDGDLEAAVGCAIRDRRSTFALAVKPWTLFDSVRASAQGGRPERLPSGRLDFYALARENATRADIVVVNHSLLFIQAVKSTTG